MRAQARHVPARGFTLVELMLAVALVMILLLGINQVFRMTGETVGTGQAVSTAARDVRAMQSVVAEDGLRMSSDPPFLIISNERIGAFLSKQDRDADTDNNPLTLDLNRNGTEGEASVAGERVVPSMYNSRNHRIDRIGFFVHGAVFPRQTGQDTTLVIPSVSRDAWVSYGHARVQSKTGWFNPGDSNANNENNRYAADFILSRFAVLLKHPDLIGKSGLNEAYIVRRLNPDNTPTMSPLTSESVYSRNLGVSSQYRLLHHSRLDLAGTTPDELRGDVKEAFDRPAPFNTDDGNPWWRWIVLDSSGAGARFQCSPYIIKPASGDAANTAAAKISDAMALAAPYFVGHCSQFIVEFAGDWLTQDNNPASPTWGNLTGPGPDGKIDFLVDKIDPNRPETWVEKVRWYGLPRDINDDGKIDINDVVPLFHVRRWYSERSGGVFDLSDGRSFPTGEKDYREAFERGYDRAVNPASQPPSGATASMKFIADYREDYAANAHWPVLDDSRDDVRRFRYVCTWRAGGAAPPRMIRFIMRIEDETGRLTTSTPWIETVLGPL